MSKTIFKKVMWLGRATTFVVGLAVLLALTVGFASAALAGTGVGSAFNLGKTNSVGAVSRLVGSVAGASLLIDNNSTNSAATALDLQVEAGRTPMKVNSQTKVANLNADKLDGMNAEQLQGFRTFRVSTTDVTSNAGTIGTNGFGTASCQPGEQAISGGADLRGGMRLKSSTSNRVENRSWTPPPVGLPAGSLRGSRRSIPRLGSTLCVPPEGH